jgi:hypothetical protein
MLKSGAMGPSRCCGRLAAPRYSQGLVRELSKSQDGGIFISYRRQESSYVAGRLYDRLADRFGADQVFIDVDTIEPGIDFTEAITHAVETCDMLLAIIGTGWLTAAGESGHRRLDDPDDIVRLEIEAALSRNVRLIPVLVEDAAMPKRQDLPPSLASLARRNAFTVRHASFRYDAERLITSIEGVIGLRGRGQTEEAGTQQAPSPAPEDSAGKQQTWRLEQIDQRRGTTTFRLSSEAEQHFVTIRLTTLAFESIEIDGKIVARAVNIVTSLPLSDLGAELGQLAILDISRGPKSYSIRSLDVKVGDQVLRWDA